MQSIHPSIHPSIHSSIHTYVHACMHVCIHAILVHLADNLPPTFGATCPSSPSVVYGDRGLSSAQVKWTEPVATDNSGVPPIVTSNYQPLQRFDQGTHVITYIAVDQSGNKATCNFTIYVIGKKKKQIFHFIIKYFKGFY